MIDLKVRRIPFNFDGVDFIWNKNNPEFAITMNKLSFFAIALRKIHLPGDARCRTADHRSARAAGSQGFPRAGRAAFDARTASMSKR